MHKLKDVLQTWSGMSYLTQTVIKSELSGKLQASVEHIVLNCCTNVKQRIYIPP